MKSLTKHLARLCAIVVFQLGILAAGNFSQGAASIVRIDGPSCPGLGCAGTSKIYVRPNAGLNYIFFGDWVELWDPLGQTTAGAPGITAIVSQKGNGASTMDKPQSDPRRGKGWAQVNFVVDPNAATGERTITFKFPNGQTDSVKVHVLHAGVVSNLQGVPVQTNYFNTIGLTVNGSNLTGAQVVARLREGVPSMWRMLSQTVNTNNNQATAHLSFGQIIPPPPGNPGGLNVSPQPMAFARVDWFVRDAQAPTCADPSLGVNACMTFVYALPATLDIVGPNIVKEMTFSPTSVVPGGTINMTVRLIRPVAGQSPQSISWNIAQTPANANVASPASGQISVPVGFDSQTTQFTVIGCPTGTSLKEAPVGLVAYPTGTSGPLPGSGISQFNCKAQ